MKVGDYIRVRGHKAQWFEKESGAPDRFPDYNALIIEMKNKNDLFYCTIMKADGSSWNIYEKSIVEHVS